MVVYAFGESCDYYITVMKNLHVVILASGFVDTIELLLIFVDIGSCFLVLLAELSLFPEFTPLMLIWWLGLHNVK